MITKLLPVSQNQNFLIPENITSTLKMYPVVIYDTPPKYRKQKCTSQRINTEQTFMLLSRRSRNRTLPTTQTNPHASSNLHVSLNTVV